MIIKLYEYKEKKLSIFHKKKFKCFTLCGRKIVVLNNIGFQSKTSTDVDNYIHGCGLFERYVPGC